MVYFYLFISHFLGYLTKILIVSRNMPTNNANFPEGRCSFQAHFVLVQRILKVVSELEKEFPIAYMFYSIKIIFFSGTQVLIKIKYCDLDVELRKKKLCFFNIHP
jgi:hypothetical protein